MRLRQHLGHESPGLPGVDQIVDDQPALATALDSLEDARLPLTLLVVGRHAEGGDQVDRELARHDLRGHQATARDRHDALPWPALGEAPGQRPGITVKLFPRDGKVTAYGVAHGSTPAPGAVAITP